jgi:hypothetical protein
MTGPFDSRARNTDALGTASLEAFEISSEQRREFAQRVRDGAETASATLTYTLGTTRITVSRSLRNLQLLTLEVNGSSVDRADDDVYANTVCEAAGVHAFGDFLLILRQLIFYFEDRRALVWDPAAQTQLLRALLLEPAEAKQWTALERSALSLDSDLRNTQAVMHRQERTLMPTQTSHANVSDVRVQIAVEEKLQDADMKRQDLLGMRAAELDALLSRCRLDLLRTEQSADAAMRNVERAQLTAIAQAFPSFDESMRYIFAQLVSDGFCRACGKKSENAVQRMQNSLALKRCAICDALLPVGNIVPASELTIKRIDTAREESGKVQQQLYAAQRAYNETRAEYANNQRDLVTLSDRIEQRFQHLKALSAQLPPEETTYREAQKGLEALKTRLETLRAQLAEAQRAFSDFVEVRTKRMHNIAEQQKSAFREYAHGFLLEQITLTWSPVQRKIGQFRDNPYIEFPAFSLDISGSDFVEPVRRDGPDQVSESQREFIDLAFRMALIKVIAANHSGTLVIDAPESSLDAVFVKRAANVLGRFALATEHNHLIVTSNILPGDLLPELIRASTDRDHEHQIVDLFDIGVPTAAIRMLHQEYAVFRQQLIDRVKTPKDSGSHQL